MASLYLYSTNPQFVYGISSYWFGNVFFVYAAVEFGNHNIPSTSDPMPSGSVPRQIYLIYQETALTNTPSIKFDGVVQTMRNVTENKWLNNEISLEVKNKVNEFLTRVQANLKYASPLIYIIERDKVKTRAILHTTSGLAEPTFEYIIRDLNRNEFEVITLEDVIISNP